jgi:4-diphosphocytidyl-2-C-methyl-D-erythritol kinase
MSSVVARTLAPAKINLGLEVLRRRADGYHDIATVMQTVTIFDRIDIRWPGDGTIVWNGPSPAAVDNTVSRAAIALAEATGRAVDVDFDVRKRIPEAAGLGGGSSDAAAVLTALAAIWTPAPQRVELERLAASIGSDVPFFLSGGRARVVGRGEIIEPLPVIRGHWCVIACPSVDIPNKTARLYGLLEPGNFTTGAAVDRLAGSGIPVETPLPNAFERPLYALDPSIARFREQLEASSPGIWSLTGAGPAHYALLGELGKAVALATATRDRIGRDEGRVFMARTLAGISPCSIRRKPSGAQGR